MSRNVMSEDERKEHRRLAREKWRMANPEKDRLAKTKWNQTNREERNAKARAKTAAAKTVKPEKTAEQIAMARQERLRKRREYEKARRAANPKRIADIQRKTTAKHRERRNAEKAAWARKNAGRVLAWSRLRQLAKIQRTPTWLTTDDHWLMEQAYELAQIRTRMFGFPWHVDHVLPLRGNTVSGLHVPSNLRVIPGAENSRKGNRVEVV